ncbi:hypothetical protein ABW636_06090 [Aquimarina sp. 2201CG1-2-11]|uniref:hypothetical protein n=1 Tax=Aquimarina discodermiae TaxID=3231043 RepID=UPI0034618A6B
MKKKSIGTKKLSLQKIEISKLNHLNTIKGGGMSGQNGDNFRCKTEHTNSREDCPRGFNGQP